MSLNSKNLPTSGIARDPLDPGTYPARVVHIVDLGVQEQRPFGDKVKPPVNMITFTYEFADEFLKDENGKDITLVFNAFEFIDMVDTEYIKEKVITYIENLNK